MGLLNVLEFTTEKFENFVGVNFWTMIFAWVNLLILYILFKKFLFVPIKNMIDSRQKEIDDMYSDAENARKSAGELKEEYEEKISHAEEESEQILKTAVRRAQLKEEEILREADKQAERTMERAHEQIELEKKQAINDVKNQVSAMAIGIASAVIERDVSESEHKELIDDFIGNMGNE
ncbi:MAG: F0F1 ATP synthase subunit B [Clostridia bacterium]|nr:F0F1 ATP synthase subunit B [Clostridia bacterium]